MTIGRVSTRGQPTLEQVQRLSDGRIQVMRTDGVCLSLTLAEWFEVAARARACDELAKLEAPANQEQPPIRGFNEA